MKTVLVVDDTKNIRNLLKTCLEIEGYEVVTAVDGKQALDIVFQRKFDLIFLDIKLPELSGTEVLRRIRGEGILIPVIIMTAFATVKNAVECTKLGAVAYLQKPFTADKVRALLEENVLGHELQSEDPAQMIKLCAELIRLEEYEEAYEKLKLTLSQNPGDFRIYELLSAAMKGMGRAEEADKYNKAAVIFKEGRQGGGAAAGEYNGQRLHSLL